MGRAQTMSGDLNLFLKSLGFEDAKRSLGSKILTASWPELEKKSVARLAAHGHISDWLQRVNCLPALEATERKLRLNQEAPSVQSPSTTKEQRAQLDTALRHLGPWKKGPFELHGLSIDAEWRSDLKWDRLMEMGVSLDGKRVLDVGTGNGYFLLRALGEKARFVLGLEPSLHSIMQYLAIQTCFQQEQMALLPLTSDEFTAHCQAFDTVLSMGVLYHRRSPLDHLAELKSFTKPGGEVIVETLVTEGPRGYSLIPDSRYAGMNNVWFLPSPETLESWMTRLKFKNIQMSPLAQTTHLEQRSTTWTGQPSLADFLDPSDASRTQEGLPAPVRLIVRAEVPG